MDKLQCMINLFSADIAISDLRLLIYSKQIMERSKYDLIVGQWIRHCHPNPWPFQDYYQITQNLICDIWYICNYIIIWLFGYLHISLSDDVRSQNVWPYLHIPERSSFVCHGASFAWRASFACFWRASPCEEVSKKRFEW